MTRQYDPTLLAEPRTLVSRFTPTGYVKGKRTRESFQCEATWNGRVMIWTIGPLGWWHNLQTVEPGTSFDDAVRRTYLPGFHGWDDD